MIATLTRSQMAKLAALLRTFASTRNRLSDYVAGLVERWETEIEKAEEVERNNWCVDASQIWQDYEDCTAANERLEILRGWLEQIDDLDLNLSKLTDD